MSIHVLKRKTNTRYSGNHSKKEGFSLNNSRRLHTPMEQSHTPLKGNVAIGNGGCCGTYSNDIIYSQNVNSDPFNQVRPSVKSYSAYLNSKKKCQVQTLYTENPKPTPSILYPNTVVQSTTTEDYQDLLNIKKSCLTDIQFNGYAPSYRDFDTIVLRRPTNYILQATNTDPINLNELQLWINNTDVLPNYGTLSISPIFNTFTQAQTRQLIKVDKYGNHSTFDVNSVAPYN